MVKSLVSFLSVLYISFTRILHSCMFFVILTFCCNVYYSFDNSWRLWDLDQLKEVLHQVPWHVFFPNVVQCLSIHKFVFF